MISVPSNYDSIITGGGAYEWRVLNGSNTFTIANLISGRLTSSIMEALSIGNTDAMQLDLEMRDVTIDATNPLVLQFRAVGDAVVSDWVTRGTFYVDTVEKSPYSEISKVTAFDSMLKSEVTYSLSGGWVSTTDKAVVQDIAAEMGVSIESSTQTLLNTPIALNNAPNVGPNGVTDRQMLSYIGVLRGGNWRMTADNKLMLQRAYISPSATANIGDAVEDFDASPVETVKRVKVIVDAETYYLAPAQSSEDAWLAVGGRCLEVNLPFWGTQAVANDLLSKFNNKVFYPYTARNAYVDPKYTCGDGITIKDVTSVIVSQTINIDGLSSSDMSFKGEEAIQSLYPYVSPSERNIMYVATKAQETADDAADAASAAQSAADAANAKFGVNLSPYFGHPFDDTYNATSNPSGYWRSKPSASYITKLEDGWAQVVCNNTGSTILYPTFYNVENTDITDSTLTMLVELKDVTVSGTAYFWNSDTNGTNVPQYKSSSFAITGATAQRLTLTATNNANPTNFTRSGFQVNAGGSLTCKARVSVYKAGYQGEYIPYVSDSYINSTYREQTIYISKASGTTSVSPNTSWLSATSPSSVPQNAWSTIRPVYSSSYPVLFVATQTQTMEQKGGTACSCTDPVVDQTTTIIDGGHITTGTIDAGVVNVTNINASNISTGTMNANLIKAGVLQDTAGKNSWNLTSGALTTTSLSSTGYVYLNGGAGSYLNIPLSSTNPTNRYFRIEAPANYGDPFVIIRSDGEASSSSYGELTVSPGEIEWTDTDTKMLLTGHALTFSGGYSVGNSAVELGQLQGLRIYNRQGDSTSLHNDSISTTGTLSVGGATTLTGNLTVSGETNLTGNLGLSGAVAPFSFANGTTSGPVLTLGTSTVTVPSASSSQSGVVTTGAQTFEGQKTFAKNPVVGSSSENADRFIQIQSNSGSIALETVGNANGDGTRGIWLGAHGTAATGKWAIRADTDNNVFLGTHTVTGALTLNYGSQYTQLYFRPTTAPTDDHYGAIVTNVGSSTQPTTSQFYFVEPSVGSADGVTTGFFERYYLPASNANMTEDQSYNILTTKGKKQIPASGSVTLTMSGSARALVISNGGNANQRGAYILYQNGSVKTIVSASALTTSYSGSTATFTSTATTVTYLDIIIFNGSIA